MEMMHHEAGVRTVVVGGRPENGPMQAPSGSRGAQFYPTEDLDTNIQEAGTLDPSTETFLPNRTVAQLISSARINLRDQIRQGGNVPLQFVYEAADCRISYTQQTFLNYTALWEYAANAIWSTPELCVQGSTGYASNSTFTDTQGPPGSSADPNASVAVKMTGVVELSGVTNEFQAGIIDEEHDSSSGPPRVSLGQICDQSHPSTCGGYKCEPVSACRDYRCLQTCNNYNAAGVCQNGIPKYTTKLGTYFYKRGKKTEKEAGYCIPNNLPCGTQTSEYRASPSTVGEHNDASEQKGSGSGLAQFIKKGLSAWG